MIPQDNYLDALRDAVLKPTRAVVGVVDDVLNLCDMHHLQIDWSMETCRVQRVSAGSVFTLDVPLRKSVFRAILARIATLCDEQAPGTFAPYGGQGELLMPSGVVLQMAWMNTLGEQKLTITPILQAGSNPSVVAAPVETISRREPSLP